MPEVARLLGRSKWAVYADIRDRLFTRSVAVGVRAVAWPASEVAAINRARIAGASRRELQALVDTLHAKRNAPPGEEPGGAKDEAKVKRALPRGRRGARATPLR